MKDNPWQDFAKSESMVHQLDRESVSQHNAKAKPEHQFLLQLAPEPWIGNLEGKLLVLYANPGATESDIRGELRNEHDLIVDKSIKNLNQKLTNYPHFFFDPELDGTTGSTWFLKKYRRLIEATSRERVAKNLVTCELAPYHSKNWYQPKIMPPTQEFTFNIVRKAIDRKATIVVGRGKKIWEKHVPELIGYPLVCEPNSKQNASISPGNYPNDFNKILNSID